MSVRTLPTGLPWPTWLPGVPRVPDDQVLAGDLPELKDPPKGTITHSGDKGPYPGDWVEDHKNSYHFAPHSRFPGRLVQMVPLTHRAHHAGAWGNDWWGVALPGPWDKNPREPWERNELVGILMALQSATGWMLRYYAHHRDDPRGHRKDPGPGVTADWYAPANLIHRPPHLL